MPKFNNPTDYTGAQGSQKQTGQLRLATAAEAAAGVSTGVAISPATLASAVGTLVPSASATVEGSVYLTEGTSSIAYPVATKFYVDAIAIAGSPVSTETTAGIGQLATDLEAVAGTPSTGLLALFVTPSNLTPVFASPPAIGGTSASSGTFTFVAAAATGTGNILTSDTASSFSTTGAGVDVTIDSAAGRVIINGEEAAANAITLLSAAGGIDVDAALQINIATSQNAADAIVINASAGGIDITAAGAAGEDIDITNTSGSIRIVAGESAADSIVISSTIGGIDITAAGAAAGEDIDISAVGSSVNITASENNAGAIIIRTNGGASERVTLLASQGTGADSINLESTAGGITLTAALATADAINIVASDAAGGIDIDAGTGGIAIDASGAFVVTDTKDAAASIYLHANGGTSETIKIHADQGTGAASLDLLSDVGGITLTSGLSSGDAININASGVAGGIDIDSLTGGVIVDTTGAISLDAAAASNFTVTGAFALDVITTLGKLSLQSGQSANDSIEIKSLIGGIDILAAGAAAGEDIDIIATGSSVNIQATESDINAITINASGAAGGVNMDAGTSGVIVDTTGAISLDAAAASNLTVTGAFALDVITTLGKLSLQSGQSANDSIEIKSLIGGIDILAAGAAAGEDIDIIATGSSVNISATESAADSITIVSTAGGIDILATGASAGEDIDIVATGSSINITATESVSDAIVINASGAASGISIDAGTVGITFGTGLIVSVTSVAAAATPYTVLGTDYFITTDTTGGVLTLTLPAAPATGRMIVVYDGVGQAAANNVTIDGNGKSLAFAGTAAGTKVLNTAYESATMVYNGTLWCCQDVV